MEKLIKISSYILFCEDERPSIIKDFPNKITTDEYAKRWNELKLNDPDRYKVYVEKATAECSKNWELCAKRFK
jgi:hypothetical protein